MSEKKQKTFLEPSFKRTQTGHRTHDGVKFVSYHTGIMSYAMISDDGQIMVWSGNTHRDGAATYFAKVIGVGFVNGRGGNRKRFRSEEKACREAVKVWRQK